MEFQQLKCEDQYLTQLALLCVFALSLPDDSYVSPPFILTFPGYNYYNILVDDEGDVTRLLDWDSTLVLPMQAGFACYLSWITCDWDPTAYSWPPLDMESASDDADENLAPGSDGLCNGDLDIGGHAGHSEQGGGHSEIVSHCQEDLNSPQTLQCYQDEYLEIYTKVDPANAALMKNSHIFEAILIAIFSEVSRGCIIIQKLMEYIFGIEDVVLYLEFMESVTQGAWLNDLVDAKKLYRVSST